MTILPVGEMNNPLRLFSDYRICSICESRVKMKQFQCCGESEFEPMWIEIDTKKEYTNTQVNEMYAGFDALEKRLEKESKNDKIK